MIGGAVAASCGSWSFPYLNACMNFAFYLYHLAFTMPAIQVPLAPSTPLALHSVSFRADKNIFLNKAELAKVVECGRKRKNPNPNKKYDTLLLMNSSQEESVGCFPENRNLVRAFFLFVHFTTNCGRRPKVVLLLFCDDRGHKEMDDFVKSLHLGTCYEVFSPVF